ncbi:uncharacterized protein CIMG_10442 [Coccidioides immitis RS]|uniref:F-box domain-containing protein n=1 Tax=Coccidioides immitis (strain RS) TaxID=246410 RepID=J3K090_COCIM|nr:uncharacterized protein CIMG_10442 [Coccidioides immitis RS]EAS27240.3 hypothetical protein CIMG_10442 [Coccidioides immitis RS]
MLLTLLPVELLIEILSQVSRSDLKRLCEVSKLFNKLATPILYRSVLIKAESEVSLEESLDTKLLNITCCHSENVLCFTRDFQITSSFHDLTHKRCSRNWDFNDYYSGEFQNEDGDILMGKLEQTIIHFLEKLEDGQLRNFSWELGTCIPEQLLSSYNGQLQAKQNKIESIWLVMDGSCYTHDFVGAPDLTSFQNLKCLSLIGLNWFYFESLWGTFNGISDQLQELELDFVDWQAIDYDPDSPENYFAEEALGMSRKDKICIFPSLKVLLLSRVPFQPFQRAMAYAFGFTHLQSLRLQLCPGWEGFLAHIQCLNLQIHLKMLEVQHTVNCEDSMGEGEQLLTFLHAFDGLEELFVSTSGPSSAVDLWCAALKHGATLKRFIHHQRTVNIDDELVYFEEECNLPDLLFGPEGINQLSQDPSWNLLVSLDLECLGMCCIPSYLKHLLAPCTAKCLLKVLHIRGSGSDTLKYKSLIIQRDKYINNGKECSKVTTKLHHFAEWIFRPEGFPSMKVLAAGDFSHDGWYLKTNVILCWREVSDPPETISGRFYRYAKESDVGVWLLLETYSSALAACPTDSILEYGA